MPERGRTVRAKDAKLTDAIKKGDNIVIIGELLKRQRESLQLSQREIGDKVGYRNYNFISMLENGIHNLPIAKIPGIVKAYKLEPVFMGVFVKYLYPEIWEVFRTLRQELATQHMTIEDINELFESKFKTKLAEFRIKI